MRMEFTGFSRDGLAFLADLATHAVCPSATPGSGFGRASPSRRHCRRNSLLLLRFQLARVRLIMFSIVLQFLEELGTDSAHEELQQGRQKHAWERRNVELGERFHQARLWSE